MSATRTDPRLTPPTWLAPYFARKAEQDAATFANAKAGGVSLFINQARRETNVEKDFGEFVLVSYEMPNGRFYFRKLYVNGFENCTEKQARKLLGEAF